MMFFADFSIKSKGFYYIFDRKCCKINAWKILTIEGQRDGLVGSVDSVASYIFLNTLTNLKQTKIVIGQK